MSQKKTGIKITIIVVILVIIALSVTAFAFILPDTRPDERPQETPDQSDQTPSVNNTIPVNNNTTTQLPQTGEGNTSTTTTTNGGGDVLSDEKNEIVTINSIAPTSASPFAERWITQYNNIASDSAAISMNYLDGIDYFYSDPNSPLYNIYRLALAQSDLSIVGTPPSNIMNAAGASAAVNNSNNNGINNSIYSTDVSNTTDNTNRSITGDLAYVPISPHAIAIVYNIPSFPDIASGLRLNPSVLSEIFTGNITFWDDAKIKTLNPDFNLPHEKIIVIREPQPTSSGFMLMQYLFRDSNPDSLVSNIDTFEWKKEDSITQSGSDELASAVRRTAYSIGYVEYSYAVQTRMTFASLENSDGDFILPSSDSILQAVRNGTVFAIENSTGGITITDRSYYQYNTNNNTIAQSNMEGNQSTDNNTGNNSIIDNNAGLNKNDVNSPVFIIKQYQTSLPVIKANKLGNQSYPVTGYYYAVLKNEFINKYIDNFVENKNTQNENNNSVLKATVDFVIWVLDDGQQVLQEIQYPPLSNTPAIHKDPVGTGDKNTS